MAEYIEEINMEIKRAIEILNPEHRERYESMEPVNEACRMGMEALRKQEPERPESDQDRFGYLLLRCPRCGKTGGLLDESSVPYKHCGWCGQAIDWGEADG